MIPNTAEENINWIIERWPHLEASRLKGTPRPWKQPTLTPEQRNELDRQAHAEKTERGAFVLGESPAPIHIDVLDKMHAYARKLKRLAILVSMELKHNIGVQRYPHVPSLLLYIRGHIPKVSNDLFNTIRKVTAEVRAGMAAHFTEVFDGQRLKADCPWCHQPKLFIRLVGPEHNPQPVVVCESGVCEPPSADCGKFYRGQPAWPFYEWEWLSNRINYDEGKEGTA